MSTTRRTVLRGLAAMPAVVPAAASPCSDPIIRLHQEAVAWYAMIEKVDDQSEKDAAYDRAVAAEKAALRLRASTIAGAIASLHWAAYEIDTAREAGWRTDDLIGMLLEGVVDVLRREAAREVVSL